MSKKPVSKKPAKKSVTKKVAKSSKPKSKIDIGYNEAKLFWHQFEKDLHSPVDFNGYFKYPVKTSPVEPPAPKTSWLVDNVKKTLNLYDDAVTYAWDNPFKSFFIIAGVVFTLATVSSIIHKYL